MKASEWLDMSIFQLNSVHVSTARLDCLVLLEEVTCKDRSWLLAHSDIELNSNELHRLTQMIERRAKHEPLAYILGKAEFYGRKFIVTKNTLQPRPETEMIIDLLKTVVNNYRKPVIADIGTGSGCIAISVKLEFPGAEVLATDIDPKCIEVARDNSERLGVDVTFVKGDLLKPLSHKVDILLCNLPYVPEGHELNEAAKFEPKQAIFGGSDGLDIYRRFFEQIIDRTQKPPYLLTESLPVQHKKLESIALLAGYKLSNSEDFVQIFRRLD